MIFQYPLHIGSNPPMCARHALFWYHLLVSRISVRAVLRALLVCICACIVLPGAPALAGDTPTCPVFLNGEPVYTRTGPAGLLSVAADAVREWAQADAAVLPAEAVTASLPAGPASDEALGQIFPADQTLVRVRLTSAELVMLLNETMVYGSDLFPHVSGITVHARRILAEDGAYAGRVEEMRQGAQVIAALASGSETQYSSIGEALDVVTTTPMVQAVPWLASRADPVHGSIAEAFSRYLARTPDDAIAYYAGSLRIVVAADTVDTQLVTAKLALDIPSPVIINLTEPNTVPDSVMYALSGQDRNLVCRVLDVEIPYALTVCGTAETSPATLSTNISVTRNLPPARKTANTFDTNTVFVDLRYNDTVPEGSTIAIDVTGIYPSESVLHVYYYDANGDIVPANASPIVDANGWLSFPVAASTTYLINARALDSTGYIPPTAEHPYTAAIWIIFAVFCLWAFLFVRRRRRQLKSL